MPGDPDMPDGVRPIVGHSVSIMAAAVQRRAVELEQEAAAQAAQAETDENKQIE